MQNQLREQIQEEALAEARKYNRRTLNISMRVGKTLIGIKVAADKWTEIRTEEQRDPRILVVAPKLSIFDGWKEDIEKFNYDYLNPCINYISYVSFTKKKLYEYDLIIFDEVHTLKFSHAKYDQYHTEGSLQSYKGDILGLTGTPPINKYTEKYKMIKEFCPIVYNYETEDAIDAEILNDYRIIVHIIPLSLKKDIHIKKGAFDFMTNERASYNYLTKNVDTATNTKNKSWAIITRMKQMQSFKSKEEYAKKLLLEIEEKCIVFANTKDQADRLCEHSYHSGNSSSESNLQLFKIGVIEDLSCVLQLSEGNTIPGLKAAIILHAYGNEVKFSQRFARCLSLTTEEMSNIHLLCYEDTVDEEWVKKAVASLDPSKIKYVKFN